ncbi:multi-pass transmembrane protein [Cardiosporidium cionae]|uniref:Multi-pass transmembrane protein n=1 Tax=Cardiosporidium cionae TaxID=476202 RepID=A0ABQ7J5G9_9APIC|nr:multi-pass transmembrane protein [Cardiosporidium cionae]|eukprot:KAF8819227.1 multi-pass transmembrane protein [Cardiosporidium cionae]
MAYITLVISHFLSKFSHVCFKMYNYGVEGDESLIQQQNYQQKMDFADDEMGASPRGEDHTAMITYFSSSLLRTGFTLQAGSLFFMLVFYIAFGGYGVFIFDIYASPESVRISSAFHLIVSILMAIYLLGILYIGFFQVFVADNSKWSRGFRTGSKSLSAAVTLDLISSSLRFIQFLYAYFFMEIKWWARYQQTKAEWALFQFGSILNVVALLLYGAALFYMEAYHDEGTYEETAWTNLILFTLAGLTELLMIFSGYGAFFSLFLLGAVISAAMWSYSFEPLIEKWSPSLHSRDINADVMPENTTTESIDKNEEINHAQTIPAALATGGINGDTEIPTSFDYSHLNRQVQQDVELGIMGTDYPSYVPQNY